MKRFLDSNVLLGNLVELEELDNLVVCLAVVDEIDNLKERSSNADLKFKARRASRFMSKMKDLGKLTIIENNYDFLPKINVYDCVDNIIVSTAKFESLSDEVILYTNDLNVQHRADGLGIKWQTLLSKKEKYTGHLEICVDQSIISKIYKNKKLSISDIDTFETFNPNHCVTLISDSNEKQQAMTIYNKGELTLIEDNLEFYGVKGLNRQQKYLMALLNEDKAPLIAVSSPAGTGKNFLVSAYAMQKVLRDGDKYNKIVYVKPLVPVGNRSVGYLPASKFEKLSDGFGGVIINTMENIMNQRGGYFPKNGSFAEDLVMTGKLQLESIEFIRGMSYEDGVLFILDEAENISKSDIKTCCERIGKNSRILILGDENQQDCKDYSKGESGLSFVIDRMQGSEYFATVTLDRSVRSSLAQECVDRLTLD